MSYQKQTEYRRERADRMLQDIAAFLQSRFNADPELKQIAYTTHELCNALVAAGVSLFTFSDRSVAKFLTADLGRTVPGHYDGRVWIFNRPTI